jgi:hypothetical protein
VTSSVSVQVDLSFLVGNLHEPPFISGGRNRATRQAGAVSVMRMVDDARLLRSLTADVQVVDDALHARCIARQGNRAVRFGASGDSPVQRHDAVFRINIDFQT